MAWTGVITDAGRTLFGSFVQGQMVIEVDSVKTGSGDVSSETTTTMKARTALHAQEDTGVVESKLTIDGGAQYQMRVGPASSTVGTYTMTEIGLFLTGTSGGTSTTVMAAYFVEKDDGIEIPLASSFPDFAYLLTAVLAIDNAAEVNVDVDTTAVVSYALMQQYAAIQVLDFGTMGNSTLTKTISSERIHSDMIPTDVDIANEEVFDSASLTVSDGSAVLTVTVPSGSTATSTVKIRLAHGNSLSA